MIVLLHPNVTSAYLLLAANSSLYVRMMSLPLFRNLADSFVNSGNLFYGFAVVSGWKPLRDIRILLMIMCRTMLCVCCFTSIIRLALLVSVLAL